MNEVRLIGTVTRKPEFSHTTYGEDFYSFDILSKRKSGTDDVIKVIFSDRIYNPELIFESCRLDICGQFRSHNTEEKHLNLFVFANEISRTELYDINEITMSGFICKQPSYRLTPNGRKITDVILAVPRYYGKADYIPCIFWGRNAGVVSNYDVGSEITITGRVQSRIYSENKIAYEVSVQMMEEKK